MRFLSLVLFPFALLYGLVMYIRRSLYNMGVLKRTKSPVHTICIGNLKVGGTGKTPHVIWYVSEHKSKENIAVLSRGYGRKSKGFYRVTEDNASKFGDEPTLIWKHFQGQVPVFVGEDRVAALAQIDRDFPQISMVVLDDAYQHLAVKCDQYILLTEYNRPYFRDFPMPMGMLREFRYASKYADQVIVTKCPSELTTQQKTAFHKRIKNNSLRFSTYSYARQALSTETSIAHQDWSSLAEIGQHLLVTSIANTAGLTHFLEQQQLRIKHKKYRDHYHFTSDDVQTLNEIVRKQKLNYILTTSKDYVKLKPFASLLPPVFLIEIDVTFL